METGQFTFKKPPQQNEKNININIEENKPSDNNLMECYTTITAYLKKKKSSLVNYASPQSSNNSSPKSSNNNSPKSSNNNSPKNTTPPRVVKQQKTRRTNQSYPTEIIKFLQYTASISLLPCQIKRNQQIERIETNVTPIRPNKEKQEKCVAMFNAGFIRFPSDQKTILSARGLGGCSAALVYVCLKNGEQFAGLSLFSSLSSQEEKQLKVQEFCLIAQQIHEPLLSMFFFIFPESSNPITKQKYMDEYTKIRPTALGFPALFTTLQRIPYAMGTKKGTWGQSHNFELRDIKLELSGRTLPFLQVKNDTFNLNDLVPSTNNSEQH